MLIGVVAIGHYVLRSSKGVGYVVGSFWFSISMIRCVKHIFCVGFDVIGFAGVRETGGPTLSRTVLYVVLS